MRIFGKEPEVVVRQTHTIYKAARFPFHAFITVMNGGAVHWTVNFMLGHRCGGGELLSKEDAAEAVERLTLDLIEDLWWFMSRCSMKLTHEETRGVSLTCRACGLQAHSSRLKCPSCDAAITDGP